MKKPVRILFSSVLKPVDDVRIYRKLAKSVQKHFPDSLLYIIGFKSDLKDTSIKGYPLFSFKRLSLLRFFAPWIYFFYLLKIRPAIMIVCTFELLIPSVLYRIFSGAKLIYDVQENYAANILYLDTFPEWIKKPLFVLVRVIEYTTASFVDRYFLAEQCYKAELGFAKLKSILLENKYLPDNFSEYADISLKTNAVNLLYYGTVASEYGIFRAIELANQLSSSYPIHLYIVGHCPQQKDFVKLNALAKDKNLFTLIIEDKPISYSIILGYLRKADLVLMPYGINKSLANRIPTKFYECLFFQKPMLIQKNEVWQKFFLQFQFKTSLWLDYEIGNKSVEIFEEFIHTAFYEDSKTDYSILWEAEELKLIQYLKTIM